MQSIINKVSKPIFYTLFFILSSALLVACQSNDSKTSKQSGNESLKVVTTFYPMYEFTKQVVGNHGEVEVLIEGQTEPHSYEPTPKDLQKIIESDVFVYNSDYMETWVPEVLKHIDTDKTVVINASKDIELKSVDEDADHHHDEDAEHHDEDADHHHDEDAEHHDEDSDHHHDEDAEHHDEDSDHHHDEDAEHHDEDSDHDHEHEGHHHEFDPHVWLSPVLAQKQVKNIEKGLVQADKANQTDYENNANAYINELKSLDEDFRSAFKNASNKQFVTQHQAFSYLADAYGLTQIPISGINPEIEPSPAQLAQLKELAEEYNIKIIFTEDSASSKVAQTLSDELDLKLAVLSPLESLSKDDMQNQVSYIDKMHQNLDSLKLVIK
ncbi:metal ABC transporter solute-binding protein, Zn/Mn family [Atopobacter phocae]|uniref:metal ABC transporter solute-binding protein, Zn/Mn family n=1 Tax=Atopobacter phocae TaxID=136492 RepID=UPI000472B047|nr:zinc ABC transporter substrate-binding protein [Atopobacter phocae]